MAQKVSRNEPCPCGSGKKHKNCCLGKAPPEVKRKRVMLPLILTPMAFAAGGFMWWKKGPSIGLTTFAAMIILVGVLLAFYNPPPPEGNKDPGSINFGGK
jgi:hypothetical protein